VTNIYVLTSLFSLLLKIKTCSLLSHCTSNNKLFKCLVNEEVCTCGEQRRHWPSSQKHACVTLTTKYKTATVCNVNVTPQEQ